MFYVGHKGFQITFPNNYIFSVQFGNGNYCGNYNKKDGMPSINAEIAYKRDDEESTWEGPQKEVALVNETQLEIYISSYCLAIGWAMFIERGEYE